MKKFSSNKKKSVGEGGWRMCIVESIIDNANEKSDKASERTKKIRQKPRKKEQIVVKSLRQRDGKFQ